MSEYAISLEGIDKSFGGVKVLDNVTFKLKKGTINALVGGNGAGKSTLMKIPHRRLFARPRNNSTK